MPLVLVKTGLSQPFVKVLPSQVSAGSLSDPPEEDHKRQTNAKHADCDVYKEQKGKQ